MITPMFHANAWSVPFSALMIGADQVMPGHHMGAADLLDLIEHAQTTMALAVPTIWAGVLQALEGPLAGREIVLKGMRVLIGGLAPAPSMIKKFETYGVTVLQGYGMTETSPTGSFSHSKPEHDSLPVDERVAIKAMQGMAPPFVDMRLADDVGNPVPWDGLSTGEVQLHGPWIGGSYHRTARDPEKFARDGWLRTGDLGIINSDGYLRIVDRVKDIIKSGGEWISSVDLENIVVSHPDIIEAAVITVHHPKWDERPLVIAVRRPGSALDFSALREFLQPHLARFQIPDDFEWMEVLPRSGTGKVQKAELRKQFKNRSSMTP
jgi:fatty-acyl-CoA synthase